ncbi:MAG TPA: serine/threonine-protein kinase [Coleofasciculaceae cyanobacterium]
MASQGLGDSQEGGSLGNSSASRFSSRYEVQQQLGKRAGRRTLLARDIITQELVVIKLLSFGNDFEWDDLKLFEREAETLKALSHPAIPRYLDYFEIDSPNLKGFALVQTYIEAKSLEEQLKAGRTFNEADIKQLAKALLEILIYLHGRQPPVIHRDIKPSNILLTNRSGNSVGQVYLVDFGSVQTLAAREGGTITVVGTYGYMPPEQFGGRAVPASDLHSLGATLIYLVTGLHPADLPQRDLRIQFEQVVNLSPALSNWLKWMIEPSLDRRLASAVEALPALEQPPQRQPNSIYSTVVRKPAGSKIQLTKDADSLKIILPSKGFGLSVVGWTLFAAPWNLVMLIWIASSIAFGINPLAGLCLLGLWGIGISLTVRKILFPLFGQVWIRFNQQKMTVAYKLLGFKYKLRPAPRQHICKLVLTNRYSRLAKSFEVTPSQSYVLDEPRLIIWAGTKKYEFCRDKLVTDPELDWLAQELSNWLRLPIARE